MPLHEQVCQSPLRLLRGHVGMTHPTMVDRTLQPVDRHLEVRVLHHVQGRLGVRQRQRRMLNEHLRVSHLTMTYGLLPVLHCLSHVTGYFKVGERFVGLARRHFRMTHVAVLHGLLQARDSLRTVWICHSLQGRLSMCQRLCRMLD